MCLDGNTFNVRPDSVDAPELRGILDRVDADGTKVILLWVKSTVPLHTFWTILLNPNALVPSTTLNVGFGTHADPRVAAARALTEAAQSRLTFIHGAREDLQPKLIRRPRVVQKSRAFRYFEALKASTDWSQIMERQGIPVLHDLESALRRLVEALEEAGQRRVARFDLTRPAMGIPVVKVIAPGLQFNRRLF